MYVSGVMIINLSDIYKTMFLIWYINVLFASYRILDFDLFALPNIFMWISIHIFIRSCINYTTFHTHQKIQRVLLVNLMFILQDIGLWYVCTLSSGKLSCLRKRFHARQLDLIPFLSHEKNVAHIICFKSIESLFKNSEQIKTNTQPMNKV